MARRGPTPKRKVEPDPIYRNRVVTKFINRSMYDGRKNVAARQLYEALEKLEKEVKKPALEAFLAAVEKVRPNMEVRPRRIGGAAYQVPMPVRGERKEALAIRWLVQAARKRPNGEYKTYGAKLAAELAEAYRGEGGAVKKKEEMQRMAEANKAFAHFRW